MSRRRCRGRGAPWARPARERARRRGALARRRAAGAAPRELAALLADKGVPTVGQARTQSRMRARPRASSTSSSVAAGRPRRRSHGSGREEVGVLPGDGDRAPNVLLPVVAEVTAGERHPARPRGRGSGRAGSRRWSSRRRSGPRERSGGPAPVGGRRHRGPVLGGRRSGRGRPRGRPGKGSSGSRRGRGGSTIAGTRSVSSRSRRPAARSPQLPGALRERLHRFEGGEREQRERRNEHAVEAPGAWAETATASTPATVAPVTSSRAPSPAPSVNAARRAMRTSAHRPREAGRSDRRPAP